MFTFFVFFFLFNSILKNKSHSSKVLDQTKITNFEKIVNINFLNILLTFNSLNFIQNASQVEIGGEGASSATKYLIILKNQNKT